MSGDKENDQVQISAMVDRRVNFPEEKIQRPKKKISKNYKQQRTKGEAQKSVP